MTDSRPTKLARLQELKRTVPYVSKSALAAILQDIHEKGLPDLHSRKHILESTKEALQVGTRYGPLLQEWPTENIDGSGGKIWITNFWSYLSALCYEGGSYKDLLHNTAHAHGMTEINPLQLCIYTDEVIPGNILGKCERRTWAIYCSFMNFPLQTLSSEYAWILLACIKSNNISKMDAGIGQVMALVLKSIFLNPMCPAEGGVLLPSKNGPSLRLYVKLHAILQDGSGHKYTYNAKGDSGWKYCLLCSAHGRMVAAADEDGGEEGEDVVSHQMKLSQLLVHTDNEILDSFDRLLFNHQSMQKGQFEIWQKACGLTFSKCALLLDKDLRRLGILEPASQYCHDWMHCLVSAGIVQTAIYVLCSFLKPSGWSVICDFLQLWQWPKHLPKQLHMLFSGKHAKKCQQNKKFQCPASEALGLLPVLVHLVKSFLLPKELLCPKIGKAFLACADIVDLVHYGQLWNVCTPLALQKAAEDCLSAWVDANLEEYMIKKFHWTLHLAPALQRFQKLPACFAMERKHRFICKFASHLCKSTTYEHTLLQECLAEELFHLKQPNVFPDGIHLINGHRPSKQFHALMEQTFGFQIAIDSLQVSSSCRLQHSICTKKDIVLAMVFQAMEILAFAQYNEDIFAFVQMLAFVEDAENVGACVWHESDQKCFVPATDILCPLIYNKDKSNVKTLIPWQIRKFLEKRGNCLGKCVTAACLLLVSKPVFNGY